jgi:hypothetical protein
MEAMKAGGRPVGGVAPVAIPPLNASPIEGQTMHEQARALADPTNPISPAYDPEVQKIMASNPHGVLPPEAAQDPNFRPGIGSMIAGNQPGIQQQPQDGRPPLSDKTQDALAAMAKAAEEIQRKEAAKADEAEEDVKEGLYDEIKDMVGEEQWHKLNNRERRKKIEAGLASLNFTDILTLGEMSQDVRIRNGLILTFRTVTGDEDLAIKRMMFGEQGGDRYLMDKFSMMQLTLALKAVNGEELPSHVDVKTGELDEEKFLDKFKKVMRFPAALLGDFGLQYAWFHERVQALLLDETDEIKNG